MQKRVGVLRGGKGRHYEKSLKEGGEILVHINENLADKYKTVDILVDRAGVWHMNGLPVVPADLMHKVDVVWNTAPLETSLIFENLGISQVAHPTIFNNRELLKAHLNNAGIKMPGQVIAPKNAREVLEKFGSPWVVKVGNEVEVVKTLDELAHLINKFNSIIVKEFVSGKPGAVHTLTNFRNESVYVLPPGGFTKEEKETITKFAKILHKHLNVKHYLKTDFILHPKRGIFVTSIYFSPDLRPHSHFDQSCASVGAKLDNIVEHIIENVK